MNAVENRITLRNWEDAPAQQAPWRRYYSNIGNCCQLESESWSICFQTRKMICSKVESDLEIANVVLKFPCIWYCANVCAIESWRRERSTYREGVKRGDDCERTRKWERRERPILASVLRIVLSFVFGSLRTRSGPGLFIRRVGVSTTRFKNFYSLTVWRQFILHVGVSATLFEILQFYPLAAI